MAKNMTKQDVRINGRHPKNHRKITLLSGATIKIDPSKFERFQSAKEFDIETTNILRVHKHREENKFLVYGMRAKNHADKPAEVISEVYELVAMEEQLPSSVKAVAEHCGVSALIGQLRG